MRTSWQSALTYSLAACAASGCTIAQVVPRAQAAAPMPSIVAGPTALYDPSQLPAFRGRVRQFTLTPRGDIDGLILADGTEVETPPYLSTAIAYSVKPGDVVIIHGLRAAALPLIQAVSITDAASRRTVIDTGPPAPPPPPPPGAG